MTDQILPICPCHNDVPAAPANPPGLSSVSYRVGDFRQFRRALLTPPQGETELSHPGLDAGDPAVMQWRPGASGDLAVMMVEWWAYLADILTFYNERIVNQAYLGTADLPGSVNRLIRLLGYRPVPAIGARGTLAALVSPGQKAVLPKGLQFQSKPGPGQQPQTFELDADTPVGTPDAIPARPPEAVLAPSATTLLLQGSVSSIDAGSHLMVRPRDGGVPGLVKVNKSETETLPDKSRQTRLGVTIVEAAPSGLTAARARLERAGQNSGLWSHPASSAIEDLYTWISSGWWYWPILAGQQIHLNGLARSVRAGDYVLLTAPSLTPVLTQVTSTSELIWYANGKNGDPDTPPDANPLPMPHTVLALSDMLGTAWKSAAGNITVWYGWSEIAKLKDQPLAAWSGSPPTLLAVPPARFPKINALSLLVEDADGLGAAIKGTSAGDATLTLNTSGALPSLAPPFNVFTNLLPVSRGKSVKNEVLGSGDARVAGQSFTLAKSPVTYLRSGSGYASTVAITVDGWPWKEVDSFYGQKPDAKVFVVREDESGSTAVSFGDGVNGARLTSGRSNVIANYRVGGGAESPPAGKLTILAQPFPGLRAVRNPLAVGGGADPDPPEQIKRYAPRSVLTFGRAVSVADFEAIAAQVAGGARVRASWAWDNARQRTAVTIRVGGDAATIKTVTDTLAVSGDPNRPVVVVQALPIRVLLQLTLLTIAGMDNAVIQAAVTDALAGAEGLFSARHLNIGQAVFDSQISAICLDVDGVEAVLACAFYKIAGAAALDTGTPHGPGEANYFDLQAKDVSITMVSGNGD